MAVFWHFPRSRITLIFCLRALVKNAVNETQRKDAVDVTNICSSLSVCTFPRKSLPSLNPSRLKGPAGAAVTLPCGWRHGASHQSRSPALVPAGSVTLERWLISGSFSFHSCFMKMEGIIVAEITLVTAASPCLTWGDASESALESRALGEVAAEEEAAATLETSETVDTPPLRFDRERFRGVAESVYCLLWVWLSALMLQHRRDLHHNCNS